MGDETEKGMEELWGRLADGLKKIGVRSAPYHAG